jgi:hypothetical protein
MKMRTSWYELLKIAMKEDKEDFRKKKCTITNKELKKSFDSGYGLSEGQPFTAWGEKWVYFPIVYDGAEWVGHAPRNPCEISMEHQGGE